MKCRAGFLIFVVIAVSAAVAALPNQKESKRKRKLIEAKNPFSNDSININIPNNTKSSLAASLPFSSKTSKVSRKTQLRKKQDLSSQNSEQDFLVRRQFIPNLWRRYQFLQQQYANQLRSDDRQPREFYSNEETASESRCSGQPCHNDGVCMRKKHGFFCSCAPGYIGSHCENRKECFPDTCKNGGTCTEESMNRHLCTCAVGFRGDNCEDISKCHPSPCRNGGECSETDESYTCLCKEGFKGKNCGEMNKCDPNPCKNSGTCFEQEGDFYCNCPSMFRGKTCEVISECSTARCTNGGTCQDSKTGYRCKCPYSFYGKRCEVTACQPNPCLNGGVCSLFGNQHVCQCTTGYSGKHCEVRSPCAQNICMNGGTCVDSMYTNSKYGFACLCPTSFDGVLCEKTLPVNVQDDDEEKFFR